MCLAAGLASVAGCMQSGDPANACTSLDLGTDDPVLFVSETRAPVLAMSAPGSYHRGPVVAHWVCEDDRVDESCEVRVDELDVDTSSQLLLTSGGGWILALDVGGNVVRRFELRDDGPVEHSAMTSGFPTALVASLRGSDTIVMRMFVAGGSPELYGFDPDAGSFRALAPDRPSLKVIAIGERNAIARETVDGNDETLYLVPVRPRDASRVGEPIPLVRGPAFSRVVLTPGDERVVATSGEGADAQTLVFDVKDGGLLDRFPGGAISGLMAEAELPGISAVSPDGSHLAYRTVSGSLALRALDTQSSCLVRSDAAGDHTLAGFGADGTLYLESATGTAGRGQIYAFDAETATLTLLGDDARGYRLAAVPARRFEMDGEHKPWAIAAADGTYYAVEHTDAENLGLGDAVFLPRASGTMWLLDSKRCDRFSKFCAPGEDEETRYMWVRRVEPEPDRDADEAVYDMAFHPTATDEAEYVERLNGDRRVCMSSGTPGSWGRRCGQTTDEQFLIGSSLPDSENPLDDTPEPDGP